MPYGLGTATVINASLAVRTGAEVDTADQPSTTRDTQVTADVQISSGVAGDGKLELLADENNTPTTVRATFRVGTAVQVQGGILSAIVKKNHFYQIKKTTTGGTRTFTLGNIQEVAL
jgi:hypothetical protein